MIVSAFRWRDAALVITKHGDVWSFEIGYDDEPTIRREGTIRWETAEAEDKVLERAMLLAERNRFP